jgi:hypothetical protein
VYQNLCYLARKEAISPNGYGREVSFDEKETVVTKY